MARPKVYADTESDADPAAQSSDGAAGWEAPASSTPIGVGPHRGRHKYVDGVCEKCGRKQSDAQAAQAQRTGSTSMGRPRTSNSLTIEMVASMLWLGGGIALEHQPPQTPVIGVIAQPVEREDGTTGASPAKASGRVMQLEASIAGKRIDRAIKGTVVAKFINALLSMTGPWAELVPLFLPPLIIGGVAAWPSVVERFPVLKGMMVAVMLPVLSEAAKLAEQQSELMGNLQAVSAENIAQAVSVIQDMLNNEGPSGA
jgi:hypothetical protein